MYTQQYINVKNPELICAEVKINNLILQSIIILYIHVIFYLQILFINIITIIQCDIIK